MADNGSGAVGGFFSLVILFIAAYFWFIVIPVLICAFGIALIAAARTQHKQKGGNMLGCYTKAETDEMIKLTTIQDPNIA